MDILGDRAGIHPFVDVKSEPTTDLTLVTVMVLAENTTDLPRITGGVEGSGFAFSIGGKNVRVVGEDIQIG
jgi:hypothetical protein